MSVLSIITVCYNSENSIRRCIKSLIPVLESRGNDVEYLVIDGASIDNTVPIIKKMLNEVENIQIISEKDHGIYDAMNKGIRIASGEYVYFLNSDDALNPNAMIKMIDFLKTHREIDCIYSDVDVVEFDSNGYENWIKVWKGDPDLSNLNYGMICSHQAILCKKTVLERFGGFYTGLKIAADWDLILRMFKAGVKFGYIDLCIAKFSRGGVSSCKAHDRERHIVRKRNKCYRFFDVEYYRSIKTYIYDFLKRNKKVQ